VSRPGSGRRIDIRREVTFGGANPVVPYSSRLLLGFLADRDIGLVSGNVAVWGDVAGSNDLVQAMLANQPPYSAANPAFSNRPAVGPGNGTTQFMRTSGNVDLTAQTDITHALVFRYGGNGLIYDAGAIGAFGGFFVNSSGANVLLRFLATAGAQQALFAATVGTVYRLIYVPVPPQVAITDNAIEQANQENADMKRRLDELEKQVKQGAKQIKVQEREKVDALPPDAIADAVADELRLFLDSAN